MRAATSPSRSRAATIALLGAAAPFARLGEEVERGVGGLVGGGERGLADRERVGRSGAGALGGGDFGEQRLPLLRDLRRLGGEPRLLALGLGCAGS